MRTGILKSKYEHIVTLDGDGQNDPSNILDLLKSYKNDIPFYLVIGNRKKEMILQEELLQDLPFYKKPAFK